MIPLPAELATELERHDANRSDAAGAREALERAVMWQIRWVADGLMADLLLRGQQPAGAVWWQQFLSRQEAPEQYAADLRLPAFAAYRNGLAQRIASGAVRPVGLRDLLSVPIRVYGGSCPFSDEGRINRQFAGLGSSLRLVVVGNSRSRAERARALLGKKVTESASVDGRFLFGRIGPMSAYLSAALFLFEREWALSPYMEPSGDGFQDGPRIVVRQDRIRAEVELDMRAQQAPEGGLDLMHKLTAKVWRDEDGRVRDAEEVLRIRTGYVLTHEAAHILFDDSRITHSIAPMSTWENICREDMVRFALTPRSLDDFQSVFSSEGAGGMPNAQATSAVVEQMVRSLCESGLLAVDSEGMYSSRMFGRGQRWMV
jgi:hypothetical protein